MLLSTVRNVCPSALSQNTYFIVLHPRLDLVSYSNPFVIQPFCWFKNKPGFYIPSICLIVIKEVYAYFVEVKKEKLTLISRWIMTVPKLRIFSISSTSLPNSALMLQENWEKLSLKPRNVEPEGWNWSRSTYIRA